MKKREKELTSYRLLYYKLKSREHVLAHASARASSLKVWQSIIHNTYAYLLSAIDSAINRMRIPRKVRCSNRVTKKFIGIPTRQSIESINDEIIYNDERTIIIYRLVLSARI